MKDPHLLLSSIEALLSRLSINFQLNSRPRPILCQLLHRRGFHLSPLSSLYFTLHHDNAIITSFTPTPICCKYSLQLTPPRIQCNQPTRPDRIGPDRTGPDWTGLDRSGPVRFGAILDGFHIFAEKRTGPDRSIRYTSSEPINEEGQGVSLSVSEFDNEARRTLSLPGPVWTVMDCGGLWWTVMNCDGLCWTGMGL